MHKRAHPGAPRSGENGNSPYSPSSANSGLALLRKAKREDDEASAAAFQRRLTPTEPWPARPRRVIWLLVFAVGGLCLYILFRGRPNCEATASASCPEIDVVTGELRQSTAEPRVLRIEPYEQLPIESSEARQRVEDLRNARGKEPKGAKPQETGLGRLTLLMDRAVAAALAVIDPPDPVAYDVAAVLMPSSPPGMISLLEAMLESPQLPARTLVSSCGGSSEDSAFTDALREALASWDGLSLMPVTILDSEHCAASLPPQCTSLAAVEESYAWLLPAGVSPGHGALERLRSVMAHMSLPVALSAEPPAPLQRGDAMWWEVDSGSGSVLVPTQELARACKVVSASGFLLEEPAADDVVGARATAVSKWKSIGYVLRSQVGMRSFAVSKEVSPFSGGSWRVEGGAPAGVGFGPCEVGGGRESVLFVVARQEDAVIIEPLYYSMLKSKGYSPHVVLVGSGAADRNSVDSLGLSKRLDGCGVSELGLSGWESLLTSFMPVAVVAVAAAATAAFGAGLRAAVDAHEAAIGLICMRKEDFAASRWISSLPPLALSNWELPKFGISIVTNRRPESLGRLLESLLAARYYGEQVPVDFYVESTADAETLKLTEDFVARWGRRGPVQTHFRVLKGGLIRAVTESYYPRDNHHHGILLEDDIEVAPAFYAWAKMAVLRYQYGETDDFVPDMYGVSLYTPRVNELAPQRYRYDINRKLEAKVGVEMSHTPYLHQTPCSWGAVYFPGAWKEYRAYLSARLREDHVTASIPRSKSNGWKTSWKRFFLEMAYQRRYYMLYPNYDDQASFSTNWLEPGEHIVAMFAAAGEPLQRGDARHAPEDYTVPLLPDSTDITRALPDERLPPPAQLPRMDILDLFVDERDKLLPATLPAGAPVPEDALIKEVLSTLLAQELKAPYVVRTLD